MDFALAIDESIGILKQQLEKEVEKLLKKKKHSHFLVSRDRKQNVICENLHQLGLTEITSPGSVDPQNVCH